MVNDLVWIAWINLTVQLIALTMCLRALRPFHLLFTEGHGGWQMDPLTEALTELRGAKDQLVKQAHDIESLDDRFVTRKEFAPVQKVVYGMTGIILTTALLSLLVLIWRTK